ncbi:hypothetical protein AGMMS50289_00710 [Betaproteobacteria bacterium]|nr:hypothetical protein AGMMS50289_00710 [Betaproteobacteria bacterium]
MFYLFYLLILLAVLVFVLLHKKKKGEKFGGKEVTNQLIVTVVGTAAVGMIFALIIMSFIYSRVG